MERFSPPHCFSKRSGFPYFQGLCIQIIYDKKNCIRLCIQYMIKKKQLDLRQVSRGIFYFSIRCILDTSHIVYSTVNQFHDVELGTNLDCANNSGLPDFCLIFLLFLGGDGTCLSLEETIFSANSIVVKDSLTSSKAVEKLSRSPVAVSQG